MAMFRERKTSKGEVKWQAVVRELVLQDLENELYV